MEATNERVMPTQFFRKNCAGFLYTATQCVLLFCLGYKCSPPLSVSHPAAGNVRNQPHRLIAVPEGKHRTMRLVDNDHAQPQQFLVNVSMIFI